MSGAGIGVGPRMPGCCNVGNVRDFCVVVVPGSSWMIANNNEKIS